MTGAHKSRIAWVAASDLMREARARFAATDVLLDIGCGIQPQEHIRPAVHICAEPFRDYVDVLLKRVAGATDRSYVVLQADWAQTLAVLAPKSVDTVVIGDVIEHLDKEKALALLARTHELARRQVLVFTPLGFLPQSHPDGVDAWGMQGAAWQEHRSGWQPEDFEGNWEFVASKAYYFEDNLGQPFPEPHGAFWAILNITADGTHQARLAARSRAASFSGSAARLPGSFLVPACLRLLALAVQARSGLSRLALRIGGAHGPRTPS